MNTKQTHRKMFNLKRSRGVALVISLILLVVMTLLSLAAVRLVSSQEKMVSQTYDRTLALQASESALRQAEMLIETAGQPDPVAGAPCAMRGAPDQVMTCGAPLATSTPRWLSASFADWQAGSSITVGSTTTITIQPEYFVEYLGDSFPCVIDPGATTNNCKRYRVTARARPADGRAATVMVQSIYATSL